jgi:hypothetical protein
MPSSLLERTIINIQVVFVCIVQCSKSKPRCEVSLDQRWTPLYSETHLINSDPSVGQYL